MSKSKIPYEKKYKLQGTIWRGAWDIQKVWDERTSEQNTLGFCPGV